MIYRNQNCRMIQSWIRERSVSVKSRIHRRINLKSLCISSKRPMKASLRTIRRKRAKVIKLVAGLKGLILWSGSSREGARSRWIPCLIRLRRFHPFCSIIIVRPARSLSWNAQLFERRKRFNLKNPHNLWRKM